jgi:serine/threonine protein kinase
MSAKFAQVGRYQPEVLLGRGRLTETYRARLVQVLPGEKAEPFSLKVLRPGEQRGEVDLRFIAAARMLQRRPMPGTPAVFEIGDRPEATYAAFRFEQGVNLRQLREQAVPAGQQMDGRLVGTIGRKLAERLVPLHAQPDGLRVHGGLSPGNVLVRPSGDLVLLDCGFAEALHSRAGWSSDGWHFAAPEQLRGEPASPSSDLFTVGALMYFLCFGRPPFDAEAPEALDERMARDTLELDGMHPALATSMSRLLAYAPEARPKSALEVVRQISTALLTANAQVGAGTRPSPAPATETVSPEVATPVSGRGPAISFELSGEVQPPDVGAYDDAEASGATEAEEIPAPAAEQRGHISADDPDVGVVYDEDDEEDEIEVGPDGKMKRRRRRGIRLLAWTKSAFARKLFRYAWAPIAVAIVAAGIQGYYFLKSWRSAREQTMLREAAAAAERARLDAAKPKLAQKPTLPPGHLVIKVNPPGAVVWIDGQESGSSPSTMITEPGAHRVVVTSPGYRMLRDVVDTTKGAVFEREMVPAVFPLTGSVGINVSCTTEGKYPVIVDGKEIGALCPIAGVRLDPGKHTIGIFVIPENRIWTQDREVLPDRPHRVQFSY